VTDGFHMDAAALDEHVARVDGLNARMQAVARAGRPLDLDAFGLLGRVFALAAVDAAAAGSDVVGRLAAQSAGLGESVRAARDAYLRVERTTERAFGGGR
jgi:hypothetical protein